MNKDAARRLFKSFMGNPQSVPFDAEENGNVLPLRFMTEALCKLSGSDFGWYAWTREPLQGKFDREQKIRYILKAEDCGIREAVLLKNRYHTDDPLVLAKLMQLKIETPAVPIGGGHVIFARYTEPDEITIFTDAVDKGTELIAEYCLQDLLGAVDIRRLLLAHEIFHAVEYRKADTIFTRTEKVELWRKPFSNRSGLMCLGEIAGMAFARELTGISFSPYLLDVLLMYGYNKVAATSLFEEIMGLVQECAAGSEVFC